MRGLLPGERAEVEITHSSARGRSFGVARDILEASPDRVTVRCPHFLTCGGCDLLHLSSPAQRALKRAFVAEALSLPLDRVEPTRAAEATFGYRALAKLVVAADRTLGSYRPFSHVVTDMRGCAVHAPIVEQVADRIRAALAELPPGPIDLRYVMIRASLVEARAIVTLVVREERSPAARAIAAQLEGSSAVARVVLNVNTSAGDALLGAGPELLVFDRGAPSEQIGAIEQSLEAGAFAQINPGAAAILYARVVEGLEPRDRRALDLYAGSGGIALSLLSAGAAHVEAIERSREAVEAARRSAERMGVADRAIFHAAAVEEALESAAPAELLVLNPPRKGAAPEIIDAIARRAPLALAYVSCDPASLARDLQRLGARARLEIESVSPVDLFPHTKHVETVVIARVTAW